MFDAVTNETEVKHKTVASGVHHSLVSIAVSFLEYQ